MQKRSKDQVVLKSHIMSGEDAEIFSILRSSSPHDTLFSYMFEIREFPYVGLHSFQWEIFRLGG